MNVGLIAAPVVARFLSRETDIQDKVRLYILGEHEPVIRVAGPPPVHQLRRARRNARLGRQVTLPTVTLNCRKTRHHLTGAPCVQITVSDPDLDVIALWEAEAAARAAVCVNPIPE